MRLCTKCQKNKPVTEFYLRTNGKPFGECKRCNIERVGARYRANREMIRKRDNLKMVETRARIKEAVFAAYGGFVCACCGEKERAFLTLDHVDNDGAKHRLKVTGRRNAAGFQMYAWLVRNNFPAGFQVLCMNCNWGKRTTGVCPHKVRCNDYPQGVGASVPKRSTPVLTLVRDEDIVSPESKDSAVA